MVEADVDMSDPTQRKLNIKTMQGEVRAVSLPVDAQIRELKIRIAQLFNVPPERQRLIFQGKLLKDEIKLSEYVKEDGCTIHMMVKAADPEPDGNPPNPQAQQPPNFFNIPLNFPGFGDPQALLGQVGQVMQQIFPGNVQGFQVNFGGEGPLFQVLQNPLNQPPAQPQNPPSNPAPRDQPAQRPEPVPPVSEERKTQIVLPFPHVQRIGLIVNALMGPQASFPSPPMPQLPVQRNPLVLLGGFLYNYQFQLLRLLPFLSRLGDLLQRESLLTEQRERADLEQLSRSMGDALGELALATQPVIGLFQNIEIGPAPGQYQLRVQGADVVAQQEAAVSRAAASSGLSSSPAVPPVSQPVAGQRLESEPGQALLNMLQGSDTGINQGLQQVLGSGGLGTMSLRDLMLAVDVNVSELGALMLGVMDCLTFQDLGVIYEGNISPLDRIRPALREQIIRSMGNEDSIERRTRLIEEFSLHMRRHLILPESLAVKQKPGFNYLQTTAFAIGRTAEMLLSLVLDYSGEQFGKVVQREFLYCVGEWAESVLQGMAAGPETLDLALKAQIEYAFSQSSNQSLQSFKRVAVALVQQLISSSLNVVRNRREVPGTSDLINAWTSTIEADLKVQAAAPPQRPSSRTYRALDVLKPPELQSFQPPRKILRTLLTQSLQEAGVSLQGAELSNDLVEAFSIQMGRDIAQRGREDADFDGERFSYIRRLMEEQR